MAEGSRGQNERRGGTRSTNVTERRPNESMQVDRLLNGPFTDRHGTFDYRKFCATLRVTDVEEEVARANQNMK